MSMSDLADATEARIVQYDRGEAEAENRREQIQNKGDSVPNVAAIAAAAGAG